MFSCWWSLRDWGAVKCRRVLVEELGGNGGAFAVEVGAGEAEDGGVVGGLFGHGPVAAEDEAVFAEALEGEVERFGVGSDVLRGGLFFPAAKKGGDFAVDVGLFREGAELLDPGGGERLAVEFHAAEVVEDDAQFGHAAGDFGDFLQAVAAEENINRAAFLRGEPQVGEEGIGEFFLTGLAN